MEKELLRNVKGFWNSAELVYASKEYTSATLLYFKCWFVLLDYIIYESTQTVPKDHSERFQILERGFKNEYTKLDRNYPLYRQTYSLSIDKKRCDAIRKIVQDMLHEQQLI